MNSSHPRSSAGRCERCGRRGASYAARQGTRILDVCHHCWRNPHDHPADLADKRGAA